jgi:hypothetical protein
LITVRAGESIVTADFTVLRVRLGRISGQIVDSAGSPATGRLEVVGSNLGDPAVNMISVTRQTGEFEIVGLTPGEYLLTARTTRGPSGGPEAGATRVFVSEDKTSGVILMTVREARVTGRLRVEGKAVLALDRVRVVAASDLLFGNAMMSPSASAAGDGRFQIAGLVGRCYLRVTALPAGWMLKGIFRNGQDITETAFDFAGGEEIADVEVVLTDRMTVVTGEVEDAACSASLDCGVVIFAVSPSRWVHGARALQTARPDASGRFRIEGLAPGEYLAAAVDLPEAGEWADPEYMEQVRPLAVRLTVSVTEPAEVVPPYRREVGIR